MTGSFCWNPSEMFELWCGENLMNSLMYRVVGYIVKCSDVYLRKSERWHTSALCTVCIATTDDVCYTDPRRLSAVDKSPCVICNWAYRWSVLRQKCLRREPTVHGSTDAVRDRTSYNLGMLGVLQELSGTKRWEVKVGALKTIQPILARVKKICPWYKVCYWWIKWASNGIQKGTLRFILWNSLILFTSSPMWTKGI